MISFSGQEYVKDCRDFQYTGVVCCGICHEYDPDHKLQIIIIDNEPCLVCCQMKAFFYPQSEDKRDSGVENS